MAKFLVATRSWFEFTAGTTRYKPSEQLLTEAPNAAALSSH